MYIYIYIYSWGMFQQCLIPGELPATYMDSVSSILTIIDTPVSQYGKHWKTNCRLLSLGTIESRKCPKMGTPPTDPSQPFHYFSTHGDWDKPPLFETPKNRPGILPSGEVGDGGLSRNRCVAGDKEYPSGNLTVCDGKITMSNGSIMVNPLFQWSFFNSKLLPSGYLT